MSLSLYSLIHPSEINAISTPYRFLRDEDTDERDEKASWEDRLAQKYYDSLYREFAVCDLKHYKSGNVSLPSHSSYIPLN